MDKQTYLLSIDPGGLCVFDREPTNSLHSHPYWEICLVLSGTGKYKEGGEVVDLEPGVLFSSLPNIVHEISSLETRDLALYFVSFTLRGSLANATTEDDRVIADFLQSRRSRTIGCVDLAAYQVLIEGASISYIHDALARLFTLEAMSRLASKPESHTGESRKSLEVERALRFIADHCSRNLSVEEVAFSVGMSARTLQRRFVAQVGRTIGKDIRAKKMRRAAHQLLMGYSVREVGESVGISDPSQFSAAFKAEIGLRPKAFQTTYLPGRFG